MSAVLEIACAPDPVEGFSLGGTRREPRRIHLHLRNGYLYGKTSYLTQNKLLRTGEHQGRINHCTIHIHPRPDEDCCLSFGTSNAPVTRRQAQTIRDALEHLGLRVELYGEAL